MRHYYGELRSNPLLVVEEGEACAYKLPARPRFYLPYNGEGG